jgi:hypothetical protein
MAFEDDKNDEETGVGPDGRRWSKSSMLASEDHKNGEETWVGLDGRRWSKRKANTWAKAKVAFNAASALSQSSRQLPWYIIMKESVP